jgi:hypothetical protein
MICPGWPQTMILLISASQVANITDVSTSALLESDNYDQILHTVDQQDI